MERALNYRHAFHAGNHADALKHSALIACLDRLLVKPKPIVVVDAFAGGGRTDLELDPRPERTGEWRDGIGRLLGAQAPALAPYLSAIAAANGGGPLPTDRLRFYPGSPAIALSRLRAVDKLLCVERHPDEAEALRASLGGDRRARVYVEDGWGALRSFLPPTPRRGLALIDPPFEQPGEEERLFASLADGLKRWATGVFLLWRPIKAGEDRLRTAAALAAAAGDAPIFAAELRVAPDDARGMIGSMLAVANPPYPVEDALAGVLDALETALAGRGAGGARLDWIVRRR